MKKMVSILIISLNLLGIAILTLLCQISFYIAKLGNSYVNTFSHYIPNVVIGIIVGILLLTFIALDNFFENKISHKFIKFYNL
jgi:hypothetical protein